MQPTPDTFLVSSVVALLIGGWSFLICYFIFTKIEALGCVLFAILLLFNIFLIPIYGIGIILILVSSITACIAAGIHWVLNSKYDDKKRGYGTLFRLHYLASQSHLIFANTFANKISSIAPNFGSLESDTAVGLLLFVIPSLGLIPLYMFKTYRPRPGMDTHFPDVENN